MKLLDVTSATAALRAPAGTFHRDDDLSIRGNLGAQNLHIGQVQGSRNHQGHQGYSDGQIIVCLFSRQLCIGEHNMLWFTTAVPEEPIFADSCHRVYSVIPIRRAGRHRPTYRDSRSIAVERIISSSG